jgi:hypothetical protein
MQALYDQISRRFPEIRGRMEDDAKLPYVLMHHLADWLGERSRQEFNQGLINRVVAFARWCEEQPRTEDAATDLATIVVVGLYEELFRYDNTRFLLPKLISKKQMRDGADYIKAHVGEDDYNKALRYFGKT